MCKDRDMSCVNEMVQNDWHLYKAVSQLDQVLKSVHLKAKLSTVYSY